MFKKFAQIAVFCTFIFQSAASYSRDYYEVRTTSVSCNLDPSPCYSEHCREIIYSKGDVVHIDFYDRDDRGVSWGFEHYNQCWVSFKNRSWYKRIFSKKNEKPRAFYYPQQCGDYYVEITSSAMGVYNYYGKGPAGSLKLKNGIELTNDETEFQFKNGKYRYEVGIGEYPYLYVYHTERGPLVSETCNSLID